MNFILRFKLRLYSKHRFAILTSLIFTFFKCFIFQFNSYEDESYLTRSPHSFVYHPQGTSTKQNQLIILLLLVRHVVLFNVDISWLNLQIPEKIFKPILTFSLFGLLVDWLLVDFFLKTRVYFKYFSIVLTSKIPLIPNRIIEKTIF